MALVGNYCNLPVWVDDKTDWRGEFMERLDAAAFLLLQEEPTLTEPLWSRRDDEESGTNSNSHFPPPKSMAHEHLQTEECRYSTGISKKLKKCGMLFLIIQTYTKENSEVVLKHFHLSPFASQTHFRLVWHMSHLPALPNCPLYLGSVRVPLRHPAGADFWIFLFL